MTHHEIRKLRKEQSKTQADVALACGVSEKTVQLWERGTSAPSPENMKKLEAALLQRKD